MEEQHVTPEINEAAERAVIEGLLNDDTGEVFYSVYEKIKSPTYFYVQNHRDIFNAAYQLYVAGKPLDYQSIFMALDSTIQANGKSLLQNMGGPDALNDYIFPGSFINMAAMDAHAGLVVDSYKARLTRYITQKTAQKLAGANGNLLDTLQTDVIDEYTKLRDHLAAEFGEEDSWDQQILPFPEIMQPLPDRQYLVKGLLTLPSLSIFYGHPGSLKTMVLLDMALCVAAGLPWLGGLPGKVISPFQTMPSPILWIDQDSGEDEVRRRIQAITQGLGIPPQQPIHFHLASFLNPAFHADDQKAVNRMIAKAKKHQAKLIVIDCLNAISGSADENSPEMANVMHGLRQLAEKTGAAVIVIHHCPLGEVRLRGHSSINGALDLALAITRESPESQDVTFKSTKSRKHQVKPFWAFFAYEQAGDDLASARFFGTGKPAPKPDDLKAEDLARYYIDLIQPDKLNQQQIIEAVKAECPSPLGVNSIRKGLQVMVDEGDILEQIGDKNAKIYSSP